MAGAKEIRSKIKSIKSTQKITRAMEMVAASKMRRAQERMRASRPYADRIRAVVAHLSTGRLEYQHPYLTEREPKRVGFIVISTDRGLCGGLNANLFRAMVQHMREWNTQQIPLEICTIGRKAETFFRRYGGNTNCRFRRDTGLSKVLIRGPQQAIPSSARRCWCICVPEIYRRALQRRGIRRAGKKFLRAE